MAVGLFRYNGDINDRNSKVTMSENIASNQFYENFWKRAVEELEIIYIKDGGEFKKNNLEQVLIELELLKSWAQEKLVGENRNYMIERVDNLHRIIPNSFIDENTIIYIF